MLTGLRKTLLDHGVLVEDWGGDVISVPVSAKKGRNYTLLEMILLQAEAPELQQIQTQACYGNCN